LGTALALVRKALHKSFMPAAVSVRGVLCAFLPLVLFVGMLVPMGCRSVPEPGQAAPSFGVQQGSNLPRYWPKQFDMPEQALKHGDIAVLIFSSRQPTKEVEVYFASYMARWDILARWKLSGIHCYWVVPDQAAWHRAAGGCIPSSVPPGEGAGLYATGLVHVVCDPSGAGATRYGVTSWPTAVVVGRQAGRDGKPWKSKVLYRMDGFSETGLEDFVRWMDEEGISLAAAGGRGAPVGGVQACEFRGSALVGGEYRSGFFFRGMNVGGEYFVPSCVMFVSPENERSIEAARLVNGALSPYHPRLVHSIVVYHGDQQSARTVFAGDPEYTVVMDPHGLIARDMGVRHYPTVLVMDRDLRPLLALEGEEAASSGGRSTVVREVKEAVQPLRDALPGGNAPVLEAQGRDGATIQLPVHYTGRHVLLGFSPADGEAILCTPHASARMRKLLAGRECAPVLIVLGEQAAWKRLADDPEYADLNLVWDPASGGGWDQSAAARSYRADPWDLFLIDSDGRVVRRWDVPWTDKLLPSLLAGLRE